MSVYELWRLSFDDPEDAAREAFDLAARRFTEHERLRSALEEARRWIGDGEFSDGLHREHWTPNYCAVVDMVDAALTPNAKLGVKL
jgi:hypothetical protein